MLGTSQRILGPTAKDSYSLGVLNYKPFYFQFQMILPNLERRQQDQWPFITQLIGVLTGLNLRPVLPAYYSTVVTCQGFLERVLHTRDTGGQDPSQAFLQMARK